MDRNERVAAAVERYVDAGKFAGVEWWVEQGSRTLTRGQRGHADPASAAPIPEDAIYRVYSMTKPAVSLMALILMEQGKLRLYDMLAGFDPAFQNMRVLSPNGAMAPAERPILVEDLLTHRAGFTYEFITGCHIAPYYSEREIIADGRRPLEDMMAAVAPLPLAFQPGSQFRYSVCTDVLAHVIERATNRTIGELLHEHIFEPLDMRDTAYFVPEDKVSRLMPMFGSGDITGLPPIEARPHELNPIDADDMYPTDAPDAFRRGGHGLFSTLPDYLKFARMLLTGQAPDGAPILSRKMVEAMRANRIPPEQLPIRIGMNELKGYGWGLGVRVMLDVGRAGALTGTGELGWAGAASTYFWVDPAEDMVGVLMTQFLGSMLPLSDDVRVAAYQML